MPRYLIADFVTEFSPKYDRFKKLSEPFLYSGSRATDIKLEVSDEYINNLLTKMVEDTTAELAEEFAYSGKFNRSIINRNAMLIHSSAIIHGGNAYLFSAPSQTGKSTHTRLWKQAFGDEVEYINDDKPVVKIFNDKAIVYGTPFDGGSGIANNISAPLKAVVFIERDESNSITKLEKTSEILNRLYFSTVHFVGKRTADAMLLNFERLLSASSFYLLKCNMEIEAAYLAKDILCR